MAPLIDQGPAPVGLSLLEGFDHPLIERDLRVGGRVRLVHHGNVGGVDHDLPGEPHAHRGQVLTDLDDLDTIRRPRGFLIGSQNQTAVDVKETTGKRKGVDLFRVDHLDCEGDLRVGIADQVLTDTVDILDDHRIGDELGSPVDIRGELTNVIPAFPYYGTIDATPLYVMLAAEYARWTGDLALVRRLVDKFRKEARFPSEGAALPSALPGIGWSDHWAFWQAGYPAVMVTDTAPFRNPHYHRSTDTPERVDYERLTRVVIGLEAVIADLAGAQ